MSGTNRPVPPTDAALAAFVRRFRFAKVLVIGDIIIDRYVTGVVPRMSPEAPIPVLRPIDDRCTLGGAANVALNIATLGGQAILVGVTGTDEAGEDVDRLIAAQPAITGALVRVAGRPTTRKTRFMSGPHHLLRLDEEVTDPLPEAALTALLAEVYAVIDEAGLIVLSDYAKGVLSDAALDAILTRAAQAGKLVIADPKRADLIAYRGVTILTPNEHEVRIATGIAAEHDAEADRAGRAALKTTGAKAVLVTRSAKGMTLVCRDQAARHLPTRARDVADVSGAGDTLVAALAIALDAGAELLEAATLANVAAGISVSKPGTAIVSRQELLAELHMHELAATEDFIQTITL